METTELQEWFDGLRNTLETAYLQHDEPWKQSGFSGPEERWIACRKPIADCMQESGSFLDIGCANGYLLECILKWTQERGLRITPYGLDFSAKLVALAKDRLPEYRDNIFTGNAWGWKTSFKFDYVRTEVVYVPEYLQKQYIDNIIRFLLTDRGKLLVTEYFSRKGPHSIPQLSAILREWGYDILKQVSGFYDDHEMVRVMVIAK